MRRGVIERLSFLGSRPTAKSSWPVQCIHSFRADTSAIRPRKAWLQCGARHCWTRQRFALHAPQGSARIIEALRPG